MFSANTFFCSCFHGAEIFYKRSFEEECRSNLCYLLGLFSKTSRCALNLDAGFENTLLGFIVSELRSATLPPRTAHK